MYRSVQRLIKTLVLVAGITSLVDGPQLVSANPEELITSRTARSTKDKQKALHEICEAVVRNGFFSGAVLVAENSQVIYRKAFGLANREWKYQTQSRQNFVSLL